jgi:hypothetical protein
MEVDRTLDHLAIPATLFSTRKSTPSLVGDKVGEKWVKGVDEYVSVEVRELAPLPGALLQATTNFLDTSFTFGLIYSKLDEEPYLMTTVTNE